MFAVTTCYLSPGFRDSDTWPDQRAPLKTPCDSEPVYACAGSGGAALDGNRRRESPEAPSRLPVPRLPAALLSAPGPAGLPGLPRPFAPVPISARAPFPALLGWAQPGLGDDSLLLSARIASWFGVCAPSYRICPDAVLKHRI